MAYIKENNIDAEIREASIDEMPSIYKHAEALITTSDYEGLPLVWLEAIASQVPIYTTPVGDYKRILSLAYGNKWKDFVFSSLREAVDKIKNPPPQSLLSKAQAKLREMSWEKTMRAFKKYVEDAYDKV